MSQFHFAPGSGCHMALSFVVSCGGRVVLASRGILINPATRMALADAGDADSQGYGENL